MSGTKINLIVTENGFYAQQGNETPVICEDQVQARQIILDKFYGGLSSEIVPDVYQVLEIEFKVLNTCPCNLDRCEDPKFVARLIEHTAEKESPEIDKEEELTKELLLDELGFRLNSENDIFKTISMPYYVKKGVCLFFNKHRTEWEQSDYLIGYADMTAGEYHCVTFRWISKRSQLEEIYKAIKAEPVNLKP